MRLVLIFLCLWSLSGCVAFLAGAATGGLVVYDKRSIPTIAEDHSNRYQIALKIKNDKAFEDSHIVVSSFNHIILLVGQTPKNTLKNKAEKIARNQPGIKKVYNGITINRPISPVRRSTDTWITAKVKTELLTNDQLRTSQIKVITENATVYLMGLVTKKQGNLAANLTRQVSGVKKVVKLFEYSK